jgi:hypothetical protein
LQFLSKLNEEEVVEVTSRALSPALNLFKFYHTIFNMPGTQRAQEIVSVNLLYTIATLEEAGICYQSQLTHLGKPVEVQLIMFRDPAQGDVFCDAADEAMELYRNGELPGSERYDRGLVETAYRRLKNGKISPCIFPGCEQEAVSV